MGVGGARRRNNLPSLVSFFCSRRSKLFSGSVGIFLLWLVAIRTMLVRGVRLLELYLGQMFGNDLPRLLLLFCCGEWLLDDGIFDDEGGSCGSDGPGSRDVCCGIRQVRRRGVICGGFQ